MKDLLIYVPVDTFASAQYEFLPLGPLYIASFLSAAGYDVDVVHGVTEDIKAGYKFYGLSATTAQYNMAKDALVYIRKVQPDARIVIGGHHFNAPQCVEEAVNEGLWDHIVIGEGEIVLRDLLSGKISKTEKVIKGVMIDDINSVPFPAYDKIDVSKYNFPLKEGLKCINLTTSRGCPFKCAFCSTSNTKLRQRSTDNVLEEVELLINKYKFNSLMFVDDTMSIGSKRYYSILSGLEQYDIKWRSYGRVTTISYEGLERMLKSGCVECGPGIESGSQDILNLIDKGTNVEDNIKWCIKCEEVGITCTPSIIIGLPGESPDTIKAAQEFMKRVRPSAFAYNILMPFPDSPLVSRYDYFKQFLTIHPYTWDDCVTKSKKITQCFVSTPSLSRKRILEEYYKNYDMFSENTGFDPRKRGTRAQDKE
ncbi:MAG: radical SAM protein [Candidatus Peribacteraceae bacterium]|nr:radical SAM protein [Candidatus Peribacteraceae bacterium]